MSDDIPELGWIRGRLRGLSFYTRLTARLDQMEADIADSKKLSLRIAELTDLVAELVVPLAQADPERAKVLLAKYQAELGS